MFLLFVQRKFVKKSKRNKVLQIMIRCLPSFYKVELLKVKDNLMTDMFNSRQGYTNTA